jgi:biopolymer transport protein ExbB/biopolymer transport protein TolQ
LNLPAAPASVPKPSLTRRLKRGLSGLATIGATAPFVGLFGTTVGIINAFKDMSSAKAAGLSACGRWYFRSIGDDGIRTVRRGPAVWAYNIFTNKVEAFSIEMTNSSSELIDYFIKQKSNKR